MSELSLTTCNSLLEEICKKACLCIREVCKQHQALSEQLLPKHAPHYGMSAVTPSVTSAPGGGTIKRKNVAGAPPVAALQDKPMPGSESARERRDKQITEFVKSNSHLTLYSFSVPTFRISLWVGNLSPAWVWENFRSVFAGCPS